MSEREHIWVAEDFHGKLAALSRQTSAGFRLVHLLIPLLDDENSVVATEKELADIAGRSVVTLRRGVQGLIEAGWLEVIRTAEPKRFKYRVSTSYVRTTMPDSAVLLSSPSSSLN